ALVVPPRARPRRTVRRGQGPPGRAGRPGPREGTAPGRARPRQAAAGGAHQVTVAFRSAKGAPLSRSERRQITTPKAANFLSHRTPRGLFLHQASRAGVGFWIAGSPGQAASRSANDKIRFACIGVGGKGSGDTDQVAGLGTLVAICDIDEKRLGAKAEK